MPLDILREEPLTLSMTIVVSISTIYVTTTPVAARMTDRTESSVTLKISIMTSTLSWKKKKYINNHLSFQRTTESYCLNKLIGYGCVRTKEKI